MLVRKFAPLRLIPLLHQPSAKAIDNALKNKTAPCCIIQGLAYARGRTRCSINEMEWKDDCAWPTLHRVRDLCINLNDSGFNNMELAGEDWADATKRLLELIPLLDRILDGYDRGAQRNPDLMKSDAFDFWDRAHQIMNELNVVDNVDHTDQASFNAGWAQVVAQTKLLCTEIAEKLEAAFPPPR